MAINPPKCAVNMEQRLAALRRDQEIDGLRVYLIKYNLFPRNRDPQNSPIRLEELKELVKHWKLHRQRGFWRDHPDKDDLVRALLQHIKSEAANKKRRQEAQDKYRGKTTSEADEESLDKVRDFTAFFHGGNANDAKEGEAKDERERDKTVVAAKRKTCSGDLFYQRGDYNDGLIYLSRIDRSRFQTENHNPCRDLLTPASVPPPLNIVPLGSPEATGKHKEGCTRTTSAKDGGKETNAMSLALPVSPIAIGTLNPALLTKNMKLKSVEGLYSISCHKGYEMQLLREGALATLATALKQDDPALRLYAAAAILNLTHYVPVPLSLGSSLVNQAKTRSLSALAPCQATRELYARMMDENVIAALLDLVHTPHPVVKALCARALLRFTIDEAHHFAMVHEGVVTALTQMMATATTIGTSALAAPNDVKLFCVLALVNLSDIPRAVTCDALLSTILVLVRHGDAATRLTCAQALLNLSILPTTRGMVADNGAVAALEVLAAIAIKPLQLALLETITCALCNLAAVKTNHDALTKSSALNVLSDILLSLEAELQQQQSSVTTASTSTTESTAVDGLALSQLYTIRKNCVNTIAILCCNPKLSVRLRNAGFIPKLLKIVWSKDQDVPSSDDHDQSSSKENDLDVLSSSSFDPDTTKLVVVALANLALDDRCRPTLVQDGAVPILLGLLRASHVPASGNTQAQKPNDDAAYSHEDQQAALLLLRLDCVTALSNLLLHPANFGALVDAGVVPAFLALIRNEEPSTRDSSNKEIQKACVYAMLGLAKDPGMKTRLAETTCKRLDGKTPRQQPGTIPTMLAFASKNLANVELCGVCISFLHHLSSRRENHELLFHEGAVALLVRVLRKPSAAEPPATIYHLWLDCFETLSHLASHETRRSSLVDDGVLEAIQHFLTVSATDQRPRDPLTDRSIVKAQYAASEIVYKMHELCSAKPIAAGCGSNDVPAFFACLLLLATQSASKNSRYSKATTALQHRIARRVALTIAKVALAVPHGPRILAELADLPPALNMIMRTGIHEAQVCAAIALCNLATERSICNPLPRIWRDASVGDFIVITLLRINRPPTKEICAKALFNLLLHEDTRDQLMQDGVLYALLKLARLECDSVRDLALRALYNISLECKHVAQLLQMELVKVLVHMYQADLHKSMKRLMVGIFSNLSSAFIDGDNEEDEGMEGVGIMKNVELQMLQEGVLSVLKHLVKADDFEMKVYVANVLYNLSCATDSRVAELLLHDESNVLGILVAELKSANEDVKKYGAKTLANLSANVVAVQIMTNDVASAVVCTINDTMKGEKSTTGSTVTEHEATSDLWVEVNCACLFALRNLFIVEANQRRFIACNGLPTLAALLTSPAMATEASMLHVATDMICSLAKLTAVSIVAIPSDLGMLSHEERLVKDGIVRALIAIAKGAIDGSSTRAEENAACLNIVSSLSSLSINPSCHDEMLRDGALDALAVLCTTNPSDARAPFKGLLGVRGEAFALHCMVVIRNLSRIGLPPLPSTGSFTDSSSKRDVDVQGAATRAHDARSQRLSGQLALVPIVLTFSHSTSTQTREHVVVSLYNLARLHRSKQQLIKNDAVKVLLRLGTNAALPFKRYVCSLALQALATQPPPPVSSMNCDSISSGAEWDDVHIDKVVQEGIVAAIAAMAESYQHEFLVSVSTNLLVIVKPPPTATESVTLLRMKNRAIEQRGAPPDWTKVLITDLTSWPEIETGCNQTTAVRIDSSLALGLPPSHAHDDDRGDDSYSDTSDDESSSRSKGLQHGSNSSSPLKTQAGRGSTLAPPRTCSVDTILGRFQLLADPKPEKVRVNVDHELAGRRIVTSTALNHTVAVAASSGEELPRLRSESTLAKALDDTLRLGPMGYPSVGPTSTLSQVRQDATSRSMCNLRRLPSNDSYGGGNSPLRSPPSNARRRSRQLEPLSS